MPSPLINHVLFSALWDLTNSPWSSNSRRMPTIDGFVIIRYGDRGYCLPLSLIAQFRILFGRRHPCEGEANEFQVEPNSPPDEEHLSKIVKPNCWERRLADGFRRVGFKKVSLSRFPLLS